MLWFDKSLMANVPMLKLPLESRNLESSKFCTQICISMKILQTSEPKKCLEFEMRGTDVISCPSEFSMSDIFSRLANNFAMLTIAIFSLKKCLLNPIVFL